MNVKASAPPFAQASYISGTHPTFMVRYNDAVIAAVFRLVDGVLLLAAGLLAEIATRQLNGALPLGVLLLALIAGSLTVGMLLHALRSYEPEQQIHLSRQTQRLLLALLVGALVSSSCLALVGAPEVLITHWLPFWLLTSAFLLTAARILCGRLVASWFETGRLSHRVAIVGAARIARSFVDMVNTGQSGRIHVVGVYCVGDEAPGDIDAADTIGDVTALLARSREERIDSVVIALPASAVARIRLVTDALGSAVADIHFAAEMPEIPTLQPRLEALGASPVITVRHRPIGEWRAVQKAAFDRICSVILLIVLAPLMGVIALAIRIETPGPVFFRQPRIGLNMRVFNIVKFRTMHHHLTDRHATEQTRRGDARVTRIGRVLRKFSLDELPQLFNILRGEMSLVGPRPHALNTRAENRRLEDLAPDYQQRHRVRPGITGWAQVNGSRGELRTADQVRARVEHDIYYIENWSLLLDLRILALTVTREIMSKRAF
jgi:Undecaprenyl-phosphate glucose phosphotransferase